MGLAETLDIVVRKADEMRERGVLEFEGDGVRFTLAAKDQPAAVTVTTEDDDSADPLADGATFGGHVPQRRGVPVKEHDDDDR